jgi:hypothetical protein
MNKLFNPSEKRNTRREVLMDYCCKHVSKQKETEKHFRTKPSQILIRDASGNYKIVSKYYYFYYITDCEYDTEEELLDKEFELEKQRILIKYNTK